MSSSPRRPKISTAASLIEKARARKSDKDLNFGPALTSVLRPTQLDTISVAAEPPDTLESTSAALTPRSTDGHSTLDVQPPIVDENKVDKTDPLRGKSSGKGRSLLQSAIAKKRGVGLSKAADTLHFEAHSTPAVAGIDVVDRAASNMEDMLELCDENDFLDSSNKSAKHSTPFCQPSTHQGTSQAVTQPKAVPAQSILCRLSEALTESCVHVSITDYTNALLQLPPLPLVNPCGLLAMPSLVVPEETKELFIDAVIDVETIVKNLHGLVKTGTPENFQVFFSRAAKLVHNAGSGGVVQIMLAESGLCDQLVYLIASRMSERPIISSSLDFIYDICTEMGSSVNYIIPSSISSFISKGLLNVLVDVLEKYAVHETICEHAMDVLSLLVISSENRRIVGASAAGKVCCIVLRENMTSYVLVRKTCTVIMCLSQDKSTAGLLIEAGVVDLLLRLLSSCGDSPEAFVIWGAAYAALSDMAVHGAEETKEMLLLSHFFTSYCNLLSMLKLDSTQHADTVRVVIYSFCKLYAISEMRTRFQDENLLDILHSFVIRHIEEPLVVSSACLGLSTLFFYEDAKSISLSEGFCQFYTKLLKKYRNSRTEPYVVCCIYELLVKLPNLSLDFHYEKFTPELVSALVHAVDLERDLSTRNCDKEQAIETTMFSMNLCGTFYTMAAQSEIIRRDLVEKINACSCFVAFLTLIQGRAASDSQKITHLAENANWFDLNNDLLFTSCLSCVAVMYQPVVYSAKEFMKNDSNQDKFLETPPETDIFTAGTGKMIDDPELSAPVLLSESNYLSLMSVLPHFWSQRSSGPVEAEAEECRQRRIEMLCWVMYHLSVACPPDRIYTIREKCIGLIRHANEFSITNPSGSWRCVVPFTYLLLSCCVDNDFAEELVNMKIFATFHESYWRHDHSPDALCAVLYVMSELVVKYDRLRLIFFSIFSSSRFLTDIVTSLWKFRGNAVLTYNVCVFLCRVLSLNRAMIVPLTANLAEQDLNLGVIIAAGIDQFTGHCEVVLSLFHLIYCICPDHSECLGVSGVPDAMSRFFSTGSRHRRLAIYSCLALSGMCLKYRNMAHEANQQLLVDACPSNQNAFFIGHACDYIFSLLTKYTSDIRVVEAATIAVLHLTKLAKRVVLDVEILEPSIVDKEPASLCSAKFIDLGCVDTFLGILQSSIVDTELLVGTCEALRGLCLSSDESTLSKLDSLRCSELFVSLLNKNGSDIPAMCAICDITQCVAKISSNSSTLQSFGIRQTLNVLAVVNCDNSLALKSIIGLTVGLIRADSARSQLSSTDCEIFVAALKRHSYYPSLVAVAGWGLSCVASISHHDDTLKDSLKNTCACDTVADCLQICMEMSKKTSPNSVKVLHEELVVFCDPNERLADAVSGLSAACAELASGKMLENRLRLQSKSIVSVLCQLVAGFAVVRRNLKATTGNYTFAEDPALNLSRLNISSRCAENLCNAVSSLSLLDTMRDAFIVGNMCEDILDVLYYHMDGMKISNAAMCALRQLIVSQQGNVGSIRLISRKAGIVVYKALLRHINSGANVLSGLWLIKLLALVASGREDFAELNIVDAVLLAMDTHSGDSLVVTQALWVYRNLCIGDMKANLDRICRDECLTSMLIAMSAFIDNLDVTEAALAVVQMSCRHSIHAREFFVGKGICGLLTLCVRDSSSQIAPAASSVVHCFMAIRDLCSCSDLLETVFFELTAGQIHASLSKLMAKYIDSSEVAEQALCLQLILLKRDAPMHAQLFGDVAGYSENLTCLLIRYISFERISCLGCEVVMLLCASDVMIRQLAHDGAPAALMSALQQHETNSDICEFVCQAISCFCKGNPDNTVNLSLRGVCEVTMQMLLRYEGSENLIRVILGSMLVVSDHNNDCKKRFFDCGIGESLLKLLEIHADSVDTINLCCKLIISLTCNVSDYVAPASKFREMGITFKLDELISQHIHKAEVCELCSIAMTNLLVEEAPDVVMDPEIHKALIPNAISLRNVLTEHIKSVVIAIICCEGITLLATRRTLLADLGRLSICEAILKAWRMHSEVDDVVQAVVVAIERLAAVDMNRSCLAFNDFYGLAITSITLRNDSEMNPLLLADILFAVNETTRGHMENAELFLGGGFFEVIAKNLGNQKNVTTLRACCENIVSVVALKPELSMLLGSAGACGYVTRIISHLSRLKDDPEIKLLCESSLRAARALCTHEGNMPIFRNANLFGGLDSVLSIFPNMQVAVLCCKILQQFLNRDSVDFVVTQGELGGIKLAQKILVCGKDQKDVNTHGLAELFATLTELSWQHTGNIGQLLDIGGIKCAISMVHATVEDATKLSPMNTDILATSNCCEMLGTLCFVPSVQDEIRDAQGGTFLVRTLCYVVSKRHVECAVKVIKSISAIIRGNPSNQEYLAKSDIMPSLVSCLEGWMELPQHEELVLVAINLLCNSRTYDNNTSVIEKVGLGHYNMIAVSSLRLTGAFEAVFNLMSRNCEEHAVLVQACWAINSLAADRDCIARLGSSGACDSLITTLARFRSTNLPLLKAVCNTIATLCDQTTNAVALGVAVVYETIISYLNDLWKAYQDRSAIQNEHQALFYDEEYETLIGVSNATIALCKDTLKARSAFAELGTCDLLPKLLCVVVDPSVVCCLCYCICAIIEDIPENIIKFEKGGVIKVLLDMLLRVINSNELYTSFITPRYIVVICKTLRSFLTGNPVLSDKVAKMGGCHSFIELINKYRCNKYIMVECSNIVRLFGGISEENALVFSEYGIWDIAIDILSQDERGEYITSKDDLNDDEVHVASMGNITPSQGHLMVDGLLNTTRRALAGTGRSVNTNDWATNACSALVDALKNQMSSATATEQNCAAIAKLAAHDPANAMKLVELGIIDVLAGLLRKQLGSNVPVLVEVLHTIHALCFRTPCNVQYMLELGVCEAVCIAYRRHHNDLGIPLAATRAIYSLSINEDLSTTLGVAGACQSVGRSLQEFVAAGNTELLEVCCRAMVRLTKDNQANHEQFSVGGSCQLLASALGMYMTDVSSVLESILWSISILCRFGVSLETLDEKNCRSLLDLHVDSSLVYVLSCFGNVPEIMEAVCTAIGNLCYSESAAEGFGGLGTCKVLVDLTKSHLSARNFPILIPTVAALANLSPVQQNVELLLQYGVLETLTDIIKAQVQLSYTLPQLVDSCCVCLRNLCNHTDDIRSKLGLLGICRPFYKIIDMYAHAPELEAHRSIVMPTLYTFSWTLMLDNRSNTEDFSELKLSTLYLERLKDSEFVWKIIYPVLCGCHALSTVGNGAQQLAAEGGTCLRLVSLLRRYTKRIDMVEQICGTVSNIVRHDSDTCALFDECEICDALIACMRRHVDVAEVAIMVATTIADLAANPKTCNNLGRSGACESVVEALQRFSGNDQVAFAAAKAISQLALDSENIEVLCGLHAYEWIISAIFLSIENAPLITYASLSLTLLHSTFRLDEERSSSIEYKKLCNAFVAILDAHQGSPAAIDSVCGFIKCLSENSFAREMLGKCGAPSRLTRSLELYCDNAIVSKSVLKAIAGVSLKSEQNKSFFSEASVGLAVLGTMSNHWADSVILESALFCITTLSFGNVVNTSTFGLNGACEMVLKAVAEYAPKNPRIAAVGCQAIFCLSKGEGNLERFDICGGVDVVAEILDQYIDNEKVVRHTCSALAALGQSSLEESGNHVVLTVSECSERVCQLISKAFKMHLKNPVVLKAVVGAISALAESAVNATFFCSSGVCPCLIQALDDNKDVVQNCAHLLETMERLAQHKCSAADSFANEKCFAAIVNIFELYSEDIVIHRNGCRLLLHVMQTRRDAIAGMILESIVRMLAKFVMETELLTYACSLIELISSKCLQNAEVCGEVGGARHLCEALEESLRYHSGNMEVLCGIFKAMLALCISPQLVMFFASGTNNKMLLHSLAVYINDRTLVKVICMIITALTNNNAVNKVEFASIDSIKILLRALSIHKSDVPVSTHVCESLNSLCDNSRDNCLKLISFNGGEVLLELSAIHADSVRVCGSIFYVLGEIVVLQKSMLEALKKGNTREHIITMLSDQPDDSKFVYGAVRLLRIIYQIETQEKATLLDPLDAECRLLVQALNVHHKDLSLCYEVCGVISFLGLNEACAIQLGEKGACVAIRMRITDAIAAVNTKLLQSALLCVTVLCKHSDDVRDKFCDADICRALMKALTVPEEKGAVEKLVMNCISAICGGSEISSEHQKKRLTSLLDVDVCEYACLVLEKRLAEANLVAAPCGAMACLSRYGPARDAFIRLGAAKHLIHVLREHLLTKPEVAEMACTSLRDLCTSRDGHKVTCAATDSLVVVSKVLEKAPTNISLAIKACRLVSVLCSGHSDVGVTFFTLGACQSLIRLLSSPDATEESLSVCIDTICAFCDRNPVVIECFLAAGTARSIVELARKDCESLILSRSALSAAVIFGSHENASDAGELRDIFGQDVGAWCIDVGTVHAGDPEIGYLLSLMYSVFANGHKPIVQGFCNNAVQILVNFVDNDRVATTASDALVNLGTGEDTKARDWLLAAGAAAACINVLRKEATTSEIAQQICNVVQFMAAGATENVLISESGACERVAVIFDSYSSDPVVVEKACKAIVNLVEIDAANEMRLEIFDVCKLMMSSFRNYLIGPSANLSVCAELCATIEVMATSSPVNLARFTLDSGLMGLLVSFLARRFADGGDCTSCCRAISILAQDRRNSDLFGKAGLCDSLTVILYKNKHSVTYCYHVMNAVHSLCHSSVANIGAISTKKFCDILLSILSDNSAQAVINDHLTLVCMKVMCFVSSVAENRLSLGESGVCRLLNRYLGAVSPVDDVSKEILVFTLLAVSTLCNSAENQKDFGNLGTSEKVSSILMCQIQELPVLSAALSAVANLCDDNLQNINTFCRSDIVKLIGEVLSAYSGSALIYELVARVVKRLSAVHEKDGSQVASALISSSICAQLVAGLRIHITARNVNRVICTGIRNLAVLSPQLKVQLAEDQVCLELVKAVALGLKVADDELLLEAIDACISVVTDSCSNQEAMGAAGLCELLADVCEKHIEVDAVIEKIFGCVASLCRCGVEPITASMQNLSRFAATDLADSVVHVIKMNISSIEAVRMAFVATRNMCANEQILIRIVSVSGCEAICTTLRRLLHNERVCAAACGALSVLSGSDSYRKLVSLGAIDLITLTLQRYPDNMEIVFTGSTNVINLCRDYDNKRQFALKGVCGVISRVLLKLGHHAPVAEEACKAVHSLSENCPENKILLGAAGACEAVITTLKAHPGNLIIRKAGTGALNSLMEGNGTNAKRVADAGGEKLKVSSLSSVEWRTAPGENITE